MILNISSGSKIPIVLNFYTVLCKYECITWSGEWATRFLGSLGLAKHCLLHHQVKRQWSVQPIISYNHTSNSLLPTKVLKNRFFKVQKVTSDTNNFNGKMSCPQNSRLLKRINYFPLLQNTSRQNIFSGKAKQKPKQIKKPLFIKDYKILTILLLYNITV